MGVKLQSKNQKLHDVSLYVAISEKGWGALAVYERFRSIIWDTKGVFVEDCMMYADCQHLNVETSSNESNSLRSTGPLPDHKNYCCVTAKIQLSTIGALRKLLRPSPGLPKSERMRVTVYYDDQLLSTHSPALDAMHDITELYQDEANRLSRPITSVLLALMKRFHNVHLCHTSSTENDGCHWTEAQEETLKTASTVKIKDQHSLLYYPNLCMTVKVAVKDIASQHTIRQQHNHHHSHLLGIQVQKLRRNKSTKKVITCTHDLQTASRRKGVSIIDIQFAQSLYPNVASHLIDPGDLSVVVTSKGQPNMNVLGIYPGTIEVSLQENENVTIGKEGHCDHVQLLEGVLVVEDFHVPLFVSLDLDSTDDHKVKCQTRSSFQVDMSVDTFEAWRFELPYRNHRWWIDFDE